MAAGTKRFGATPDYVTTVRGLLYRHAIIVLAPAEYVVPLFVTRGIGFYQPYAGFVGTGGLGHPGDYVTAIGRPLNIVTVVGSASSECPVPFFAAV